MNLKESMLSRVADLTYAVRFLRLLVTPWEKTEAFKNGVVDKNGKKLKKPDTPEAKSAYTLFHKLVFNIKRLLNKAPGGKSKLASYAAALFLIREHTGMSEDKIKEILDEALDDALSGELDESAWFVKENQLMKGKYMLINDIALSETAEVMARARSRVLVNDHIDPIGTFSGINIYEVEHIPTGKNIFITNQDIQR
jgi:hypothetical protein